MSGVSASAGYQLIVQGMVSTTALYTNMYGTQVSSALLTALYTIPSSQVLCGGFVVTPRVISSKLYQLVIQMSCDNTVPMPLFQAYIPSVNGMWACSKEWFYSKTHFFIHTALTQCTQQPTNPSTLTPPTHRTYSAANNRSNHIPRTNVNTPPTQFTQQPHYHFTHSP